MRSLLLVAVASIVIGALAQTVQADALNAANQEINNANRTATNAENAAQRSEHLFDRLKSWFKGSTHHGSRPNALVREIQERLAALGYDPGPADGLIGPKTLDAVAKFQQLQGLPVDRRITAALARQLKDAVSTKTTARSAPAVSTAPAVPTQSAVSTAPAAPTGSAVSAPQPSKTTILLALQYAAGADAHEMRCTGKRDAKYRDDFLGLLAPGEAARYQSVYENEFTKQYAMAPTCQPQVTKWLASMYQQEAASLGTGPATTETTGGQSAVPAPPVTNAGGTGAPSGSSAPVAPSTSPPTSATGNAPPLSNPYAALSSNLVLGNSAAPSSTGIPPSTTVSPAPAVDPALIGQWAWVSPQQGIFAFLKIAGNSTYEMKRGGNRSTTGKIEAHDGMLRLTADNGGGTSEFRYQTKKPNEIDLVDAAGAQTVLLKTKGR